MPFGGDKFVAIPSMISMIRSYVRRDYTVLPKGAILATIGALIYFFSPLDAAFVLNACLKLVKSDVDEYRNWQTNQQKLED